MKQRLSCRCGREFVLQKGETEERCALCRRGEVKPLEEPSQCALQTCAGPFYPTKALQKYCSNDCATEDKRLNPKGAVLDGMDFDEPEL